MFIKNRNYACKFILATAVSLGISPIANALPVIDQIVPTGGQAVKVYPDHLTPGVYWYIPVSVEPWSRDNTFKSSLYKSSQALSFVFRGQASVDMATLKLVAKALGTKVDNLTPIAYDYSRNLICEDIFAGGVTWKFPSMIGNYLEVVPVSLRTTDPSLITELDYHISNGGLACTVEVGFKGVYTSYDLKMVADFDEVYREFEAAAHAEYLWWEVDLHTTLRELVRKGKVKITTFEDPTTPLTESDKKVRAAMDEIIKMITKAMFEPVLKLPSGGLPDRGRPWSLRVNYLQQNQNYHYEAELNSQNVVVKDTQIGLRLATH